MCLLFDRSKKAVEVQIEPFYLGGQAHDSFSGEQGSPREHNWNIRAMVGLPAIGSGASIEGGIEVFAKACKYE